MKNQLRCFAFIFATGFAGVGYAVPGQIIDAEARALIEALVNSGLKLTPAAETPTASLEVSDLKCIEDIANVSIMASLPQFGVRKSVCRYGQGRGVALGQSMAIFTALGNEFRNCGMGKCRLEFAKIACTVHMEVETVERGRFECALVL